MTSQAASEMEKGFPGMNCTSAMASVLGLGPNATSYDVFQEVMLLKRRYNGTLNIINDVIENYYEALRFLDGDLDKERGGSEKTSSIPSQSTTPSSKPAFTICSGLLLSPW